MKSYLYQYIDSYIDAFLEESEYFTASHSPTKGVIRKEFSYMRDSQTGKIIKGSFKVKNILPSTRNGSRRVIAKFHENEDGSYTFSNVND